MSTPSDDGSAAAKLLAEVMALPVPERSAMIAKLLRERGLADDKGKLMPDSTLQGSLKQLLGTPTSNQLGTLRAGLRSHGLLVQRGDITRVLLPDEKEASVPDSTTPEMATEPAKRPTPPKPSAKKPTTKAKPTPRKKATRPAPQGTQPPAPPEPPASETTDKVPSEVTDDGAEQADIPSSPGQTLIDRASRRAREVHSQATAADLALELIAGMNVDSDELPRVIEQLTDVLKRVEAGSLPQLVEALRSILQDLPADEN